MDDVKKGVVNVSQNLIVNLSAGQSVDVLVKDGVVFLPAFSAVVLDGESEKPSRKSATAAAPAKEAAPETASTSGEKLTEKEVKAMTKEELADRLSADFGIDHTDFEGSFTQKKLRTLYLDALAGKIDGEPEQEEEEEAGDPENADLPAPTRGRGRAPKQEEAPAPARSRGRGKPAPVEEEEEEVDAVEVVSEAIKNIAEGLTSEATDDEFSKAVDDFCKVLAGEPINAEEDDVEEAAVVFEDCLNKYLDGAYGKRGAVAKFAKEVCDQIFAD